MAGQIEPLDPAVDHIRGPVGARTILEYGDFECPFSRRAFREMGRLEQKLDGDLRFAFRHFPLTHKHPHAWVAACAAEAAALQDRFWDMYDLLFPNQGRLEDDDLRGYAVQLSLDGDRFDRDRRGDAVLQRITRDMESGIASGVVHGTPTLFIDGELYEGQYYADTLLEVLGRGA